MHDRVESELYASIATLDQFKKMFDMGAVDVRSYERESEALIIDVRENLDRMRRMGRDVSGFLENERIISRFPEASGILRILPEQTAASMQGMTSDEYYDYIGLAVLDVATENSSKGLMGLAELIVDVVRRLPELKSVSYNDVIEAVNRVAEHGLIPGIRTLSGGVKVVELRPLELRQDQADVINLAASKGFVSIEEVIMKLKWSEDHARTVLSSLVEAGMAVADIRFSTGGRYYFPGLRSRTDIASEGRHNQ
ncbi:hypothetical protein EU538_04700 [Candidatus Thorarchaeota archaeon]|jgi:hypothetical protein|nr:MAG: hypothetical protein EU538_04700 [Candidatus Thorarchaeota archaeon]